MNSKVSVFYKISRLFDVIQGKETRKPKNGKKRQYVVHITNV